jgi:peptide subunit release factor 1 (eRF1)
VETLLYQEGLDRAGGRCPQCGLLSVETSASCPVDGAALARVDPLREAALESALEQDAEIVIVHHHPDLGPLEGMAAILRF